MKVIVFLLGLVALALFNGLLFTLFPDVLLYLMWCIITGGLYGYIGARLILQD